MSKEYPLDGLALEIKAHWANRRTCGGTRRGPWATGPPNGRSTKESVWSRGRGSRDIGNMDRLTDRPPEPRRAARRRSPAA